MTRHEELHRGANAEDLEVLASFRSVMCSGNRESAFRMTIPPQPMDTDMLITRVIHAAKKWLDLSNLAARDVPSEEEISKELDRNIFAPWTACVTVAPA